MIDWFDHLLYWHWLVAGGVLVILEMLLPGVFFLWLGIAAGIVGVTLWIWPGLPWMWQVVLFSVLSIVSILAWLRVLRRHPVQSDQPTLNRRGQAYVGRVFTLEQPIVNGQGKIRVDDTTWKIHGEDAPAGGKVRVAGVEGTVLRVAPVDVPVS